MGKRIFPRIVLELKMLFQIKNNAFLKDTANKHHVINDVSTEFKKAGCNAFHSSDDADIDIIL